jgi:hypothetical protein
MIGTAESSVFDGSPGETSATMGTAIVPGQDAIAATPDHEVPFEEFNGTDCAGFDGFGDGMPISM